MSLRLVWTPWDSIWINQPVNQWINESINGSVNNSQPLSLSSSLSRSWALEHFLEISLLPNIILSFSFTNHGEVVYVHICVRGFFSSLFTQMVMCQNIVTHQTTMSQWSMSLTVVSWNNDGTENSLSPGIIKAILRLKHGAFLTGAWQL